MKPDAWKYQVNGVHTNIEEIEPPDDAYDEGTLTPMYSAATIRKWLEEVTEEMANAGYDATNGGEDDVMQAMKDIYRAMIAAKLQEREACANDKLTCMSRLTIYEAGEHEAWIDYSGGIPRILIRRMA